MSEGPACERKPGASILTYSWRQLVECRGHLHIQQAADDTLAVQEGAEVQRLLDTSQAQIVAAEVQYLRQQLRHLPEWHPGSACGSAA